MYGGIDESVWAGWGSELAAASGKGGSLIGDAPYDGGAWNTYFARQTAQRYTLPQFTLIGPTRNAAPAAQAATGGISMLLIAAVALGAVLLLRK